MKPHEWLEMYSRLSIRQQKEVREAVAALGDVTDKAHDADDHLPNRYCVDCTDGSFAGRR
jgi:hypothetical protein